VTALIASSMGLIAVAAAALVLGWLMESAGLIWTSIAASVASGVCLALAYSRSRAAALAPPPGPDPNRVRVQPAPRGGDDTDAFALFDEGSGMEVPPVSPDATAGMAAARAGVPTRPETPYPARVASKPQSAPAVEEDVIAVPARGKYHRAECRYARVEGAERMPRSAARRRAYTPCGTCKP
jgi:hypothetical protein